LRAATTLLLEKRQGKGANFVATIAFPLFPCICLSLIALKNHNQCKIITSHHHYFSTLTIGFEKFHESSSCFSQLKLHICALIMSNCVWKNFWSKNIAPNEAEDLIADSSCVCAGN
jgi:hypothetical protein